MDAAFVLTYTINTTDALLDTHRIPRQIIVDQERAKLQINTFARYLRGKEQFGFRIGPELVDQILLAFAHAAHNEHTGNAILTQAFIQITQGFAIVGEQDNFLIGIFSPILTQLFNQDHEVKAFLTRKGDYFIPLEERVRISREYGADLFVSLHTDGSFNSQVRGSSVYCLSLSGATDETARVLADKENMSNILGGALLKPAVTKDPNLNQILLDLMINNSMKESIRFAELALQEIRNINRLKYPTFRQANFIVLRAPDTPSTLVEMAYITNRDDELLLNQDSFQEKLATTLAGTISRFFKDGQ